MVSGKASRRGRQAVVVSGRSRPWGSVAGVVVVVLFAAGVFGYAYLLNQQSQDRDAALAAFTPAPDNQDPSRQIPGVTEQSYEGGQHVSSTDQVAYTQSPPTGGTHDQHWAACSGVVYPQPVRSENLVHSMEHGAAWIAYDPDRITGAAVTQLAQRAESRPYTAMSPYPGLDQPISLQSWGHQLKLTDPADPRIDQFLAALRANPYTHPEVGASCQALGPGQFDQDRPPPYQPAPPVSSVDERNVHAEREVQAGNAGAPASAEPDGRATVTEPGG